MENNNTKIWQILITIIVIGSIAWIIVKSPSVPAVDQNTDTTGQNGAPQDDANIDSEQLCFIWNTEAGDKAQLAMDIRGNVVVGEFNWLPAEKDKKTGIFMGEVTDVSASTMTRRINAWWQASAEGMTNTEQLSIVIEGNMAGVGFGEMVDDGTGQYVYANPNNLSYEPKLSATDCGDEAMD